MSQVEDCKLKTIDELPFNEVLKNSFFTHTIWTILYGSYHMVHIIRVMIILIMKFMNA